jgi:hypothetical protein
VAATVALIVAACSSSPTTPSAAAPGSPRSTNGQTTPPTIGAAQLPQGPSRASLIQQAVDDGQLTELSGLLYRAYAALNLPELLPSQFQVGGPGTDDGVLADLADLSSSLSPSDLARVTPLLVRPTDPRSIFAAQPSASLQMVEDPNPSKCANWDDSGTLDARFKVWACADRGADDAELDIATAVALIKEIWDPMTVAEPNGMGPPKPDGPDGGGTSPEYGGDSRIDFYLLDLGQIVYREGNNEIPEDAAAAAQVSAPYLDASGQVLNSSSGFVLLNRSRLDSKEMKQDIIHEFFHVLQMAHNRRATHDHGLSHWFVEASATWAETWYDRSESEVPHARFPTQFQSSPAGLESADIDHQYASYIWPFFMQQELDEKSIFDAWQSIDPLAPADFAGVTAAINDELPFDKNFREFAVRNLDLDQVLTSAQVPTYHEADSNFYQNSPPAGMIEASIIPGEPYESQPGPAVPLNAAYWHFTIAPTAKLVTVSIANVSPFADMDGDVLLRHSSGKWERRKFNGSEVKFCRDDPGQDIDAIYLVVSDHSTTDPLVGYVEASAKETCSGAIHVGGTIAWDATTTSTYGDTPTTDTVSGSMHMILASEDGGPFTLEQGPDSSYSYDYDTSGCSPTGHFAGVLKALDAQTEPTTGIGKVIPQGKPGQDLPLTVYFGDKWTRSCNGSDPYEDGALHAFPGCAPASFITGLFDSNSNSYNFRCETLQDEGGYHVSGHITGTFTLLDSQSPAP